MARHGIRRRPVSRLDWACAFVGGVSTGVAAMWLASDLREILPLAPIVFGVLVAVGLALALSAYPRRPRAGGVKSRTAPAQGAGAVHPPVSEDHEKVVA